MIIEETNMLDSRLRAMKGSKSIVRLDHVLLLEMSLLGFAARVRQPL
jgi:hypothetical protein